jgi:antitoxin YefM
MTLAETQYMANEDGNTVAAIVPIELWREIESDREPSYLPKSENMKRRLLEAKNRQEDISFDEAREKLGI